MRAPMARPTEPTEEIIRIEGRRATLEALRSGARVLRVRVSNRAEPSETLAELEREANGRHIRVELVPPSTLETMTSTGHHQGVIADVRAPEPLDLDALLALTMRQNQEPFFVMLDGLQDPQNVGAIARSAEAAGANGLIITEKRAAGITPGAIRASAGALLLLPVAVVPNGAKAIEQLKKAEVWVAGTAATEGKPYSACDFKGRLVLVIGSEGKGLQRLVQDRCDFLVSIPLKGRVESLNASAAAAIVLFEAARQRAAGAPVKAPPT